MLLLLLASGGSIPSELCGSTGISVDVSNTDINCYGGCLTSASVTIQGATNECHDGSIMERFLILTCSLFLVGLMVPFVSNYYWPCRPSSPNIDVVEDAVSGIDFTRYCIHWFDRASVPSVDNTKNIGSLFSMHTWRELCTTPFYSVFAFIELVTTLYVWSALYFPPINCITTLS